MSATKLKEIPILESKNTIKHAFYAMVDSRVYRVRVIDEAGASIVLIVKDLLEVIRQGYSSSILLSQVIALLNTQ